MKLKSSYTLPLIAALLLLPLMISNESFWMDECGTAGYGLDPTLGVWWQHFSHDIGGDCQLPLSLFVAWVTAHVFGTHEWQFRSVNLLWGTLAIIAMYRAGKRLQLPWLPLLLAVQPYFWFYTNEARPYALELAYGAWLFAGLTSFIDSQGAGEAWAWEFSLGSLFLCTTTMLGPLPIAMTLMAGAILAIRGKWKIRWRSLFIFLGAVVASIPIGVYYIWTLLRGVGGARLWHISLSYFGYVVYEVTGMIGLGPRIDSIRELARSGHVYQEILRHGAQFLLPLICLVLLLWIVIFGLRKWSAKPKSNFVTGYAIVLIATSLVFIVVSIAIQKAFWGRHLAPVVPFYVALLGKLIADLYESKKQRVAIFGFIILLICSSLNLRFGAEHRKENYRAAADVARSALAEDKSVLWSAAYFGATYYGLGCSITEPEKGKVFCPISTDVRKFPLPDVIVYSKPDVFDADGIIAKMIQQNGYRQVETLNSFVIWAK